MSLTDHQVRRATIDDLPQLIALWREERLPAEELEKRFKEFQLIADAEGHVLGAIALQVSGTEANLHSEVIAAFDQANNLRALLWQRIQTMAGNLGIVRIWTQLSAPFWRNEVFQDPAPEVFAKRPQAFGSDTRPWLCVQLREERATGVSLEHEFALLKAVEQARTEKLRHHAKVLKIVAVLIAFLVLGLAVVWAYYFIRFQHNGMIR